MRESDSPYGVWDLSVEREARVQAFIQSSARHLKEDVGNYLTLNRITADRSEKQQARYTDRRQPVDAWLRRELSGLGSAESLLKLRLRQWVRGGQGLSGLVFQLKKRHDSRSSPPRAVAHSLDEARSALAQAVER